MSGLSRDVAVAGVGYSTVARSGQLDVRALTHAACTAALDDAGVSPDAVDGIVEYQFGQGDAPTAIGTQRLLGIPNLAMFNDLMGTAPSGLSSAMDGAMAIASGVCETVLVYRCITRASGHTGAVRSGPPEARGALQFAAPYGYGGGIILAMAMRKQRRVAELGGSYEDYGRIAINALARFIVELNDLHSEDPGILVNVGHIKGGGPVNVVPDLAACRFNIRVAGREEQKIVETNLHALVGGFQELDGLSLELDGDFSRPPKPIDEKTHRLFELVADCGRDLGITLGWRPSGGACDGNNLAAAGLPTIDSLGVRGDNLHSDEEVVFVDSLAERAQLTALVLMKLAAGESPFGQ